MLTVTRPPVSTGAMTLRVCLLSLAIALGGCASANLGASQPQLLSSKDENIERVLIVKEYGIVVTDVDIYRNGSFDCYGTNMQVSLAGENKTTRIDGSRIMLIPARSGADTILSPGKYVVQSIYCGRGKYNHRYLGPHATFTVQAGEIVDIGVIRLDLETEGLFPRQATAKRSVRELSPEVTALLQRDTPQSLPKVVKRPMVLLGSPETQIKIR